MPNIITNRLTLHGAEQEKIDKVLLLLNEKENIKVGNLKSMMKTNSWSFINLTCVEKFQNLKWQKD